MPLYYAPPPPPPYVHMVILDDVQETPKSKKGRSLLSLATVRPSRYKVLFEDFLDLVDDDDDEDEEEEEIE